MKSIFRIKRVGDGIPIGGESTHAEAPGSIARVERQRNDWFHRLTAGKWLHPRSPVIEFYPWQMPVFEDRETGVLILFCARQVGKSYVLAAWSVDRVLQQLLKPENESWLVTVLSNSRDNGAEFALKCQEVCRRYRKLVETVELESNAEELDRRSDISEDVKYELMRFEIRVTVAQPKPPQPGTDAPPRVGRIKILAANPRTARGFSGDLVLDEFAFHQDSAAIWEAAEPILARNPEFLCRIASTANGKHNLFYRMVTASVPVVASPRFPDRGDSGVASAVPSAHPAFKLVKVTAYDFHAQGGKIYDLVTRKPVTPEQSREKALDKQAWDQNYGCSFTDELGALLTPELIDNAEAPDVGEICQGDWTYTALDRLRRAEGDLYVGVDVGRTRDLTVISVGELLSETLLIRGMLRLQNMRLPQQQERLDQVLALGKLRACCIDMTGLGLGLCEYTQQKHGRYRVRGVDFRSTVPLSDPRAKPILEEGRRQETVSITEVMAVALMQRYEGKRIKHIPDVELRNDLLKPERVVSTSGRVSVAAVRSVEDHADHFWSLALCNEAIGRPATGPRGLRPEDITIIPIRSRVLGDDELPPLEPWDGCVY